MKKKKNSNFELGNWSDFEIKNKQKICGLNET